MTPLAMTTHWHESASHSGHAVTPPHAGRVHKGESRGGACRDPPSQWPVHATSSVVPPLPSHYSDIWRIKGSKLTAEPTEAPEQHQHAATKVRVTRPRRFSDPPRSDCMQPSVDPPSTKQTRSENKFQSEKKRKVDSGKQEGVRSRWSSY